MDSADFMTGLLEFPNWDTQSMMCFPFLSWTPTWKRPVNYPKFNLGMVRGCLNHQKSKIRRFIQKHGFSPKSKNYTPLGRPRYRHLLLQFQSLAKLDVKFLLLCLHETLQIEGIQWISWGTGTLSSSHYLQRFLLQGILPIAGVYNIYPPWTNIAPENRPSQKETHLPTIDFQGPC